MIRTNFTVDGLDIGKADRNLAYYYGLSDFWSFMFEDREKIDLLLEATSQNLSDIYSKFLQLTSTISLEDIVTTTGKQLQLVLIDNTSAVVGKINTYTLPSQILGARFIANRPLLPTVLLEDEVHYHISADGMEITFYQDLSLLSFPTRVLADGTTKQFALWFVDAKIDDQFLYNFYGKLLGLDPQASTESFKNFIAGLYFLYVNGPSLDLVRKGLNLTLGIPLAREAETVLDIRKYLDTDQYLVITDLNSYLIPYGLVPTVAAGDDLVATDELASWVDVKDYVNSDGWWINLQIPPKLMPFVPPGQPDRYATAGSYADYIMRNFLKYHTFLVNVKTIDFKNLQSFSQLSSIIDQIKPTYTTPIYIWTVPTGDEVIEVNDDGMMLRYDISRHEDLTVPNEKMVRLPAIWAEFKTDHGANITVNGDQISYTTTDTNYKAARANLPFFASQDAYFEVTILSTPVSGETRVSVGVGDISASLTAMVGSGADNAWGYHCDTTGAGSFKRHSGSNSAYGATLTTGDVVGVYLQLSTGDLTFYKNGVSQGVAFSGLTGTLYPMVAIGYTVNTMVEVNLGAKNFAYAPPNVATTNPGVFKFDKVLTRGKPIFSRYNMDPHDAALLGYSPQINGSTRTYEGGFVSGFVNYIHQFRENTYREAACLKTFLTGAQDVYQVPPNYINFPTTVNYYDASGQSVRVFPQPNTGMRVIPLYTTTQDDLVNKFSAFGATCPGLDTWTFTFFQPISLEPVINETQIDEVIIRDFFSLLTSGYAVFFQPGITDMTIPLPPGNLSTYRADVDNYLRAFTPRQGYNTYKPLLSDLVLGDYLLFIRVIENIVGAYWVTSNTSVQVTPFWPSQQTDALTLSMSAPIARGLGPYSTWYYLRGAGFSAGLSVADAATIDVVAIDSTIASSGGSTYYVDSDNPTPVLMDRSGKILVHKRDTRWM
jgi:hypothetical protein